MEVMATNPDLMLSLAVGAVGCGREEWRGRESKAGGGGKDLSASCTFSQTCIVFGWCEA